MASTSGLTGTPRWRAGLARMLVESAIFLTLSVILFRTFLAQGYMIETGSMAPGLWGYHRRAACPSCRFEFSVGESRASGMAVCPNCGQGGIDLDSLRRNDGDQLLVTRFGFDFQPPRRWGVVVFRNPADAKQAYVKRVVGLPGEQLQIKHGDIYIGDRIQAKPLDVQRSMRILVHDQDYLPEDKDPDWRPRWLIDPAVRGWETHGAAFGFDDLSPPPADQTAAVQSEIELTSASDLAPPPLAAAPTAGDSPEAESAAPLARVSYRHWIRTGGRHRTSVRLSKWPASVPLPERAVDILEYDSTKQTLVCRGALPATRRDELLSGRSTREFRRAIEELYDGSHIGPVLDAYGYNGTDPESGRREARDFALVLRLTVLEGSGEFAMGISDGTQSHECRFNLESREIHVIDSGNGKILKTWPLPDTWMGAAELELSLMDHQLGLAIDGTEVFTWSYSEPEARGKTPWRPAWFGARQLKSRVTDVRLYRDVHYTSGEFGRAYDEPIKLGDDEFFVLGDNSPVSRDSRSWEAGHVLTSELLLGKPFLVHLPSVRREIQLGGWRTEVRIPELSRIRYIR